MEELPNLLGQAIREGFNPSSLLREFGHKPTVSYCRSPLKAVSDVATLTLRSRIELNDVREYDLMAEADGVVLSSVGLKLSFPRYVTPVLEFMLMAKSFTAARLPVLDDESKLIFAKRLMMENVLLLSS
jgi:hypothetical protein